MVILSSAHLIALTKRQSVMTQARVLLGMLAVPGAALVWTEISDENRELMQCRIH